MARKVVEGQSQMSKELSKKTGVEGRPSRFGRVTPVSRPMACT